MNVDLSFDKKTCKTALLDKNVNNRPGAFSLHQAHDLRGKLKMG